MGSTDVIDLSSDEEEQPRPSNKRTDFEDYKFLVPLASVRGGLENPPGIFNRNDTCRALSVKKETEELSTSFNGGSNIFEQAGSTSAQTLSQMQPVCRQFWKSGDYKVKHSVTAASENGRNRLRINPRFLHSNATSHKWAFGAIAELLDNAIDEVINGATFVRVDKFICAHDDYPALLVQDDGGGMDPDSLRRCMSFGFSDKNSESFIGQYGNGFKTSTMRLGADVIVFTRHKKNMKDSTLSVGLLSYTFLTRTGCDDIVVPTVDYEFDSGSAALKRLIRISQKQFSSNLSMLLKWSPFTSEDELCRQFEGMGDHGTKILVYNLWHNDDGNMELDFSSDPKDIVISGARKPLHRGIMIKDKENLTQKNVATRLRYSLRAYASVLYLHMPENFKIILRGEAVEPHHIVNDMMYRECILYRPNIGGITDAAVVTTIGYVIGAPNVDVEGFNIYHKNRLISPFLKVVTNSYGKGRGVIGVLQANFVKPTHDKQDFEKSVLFQRLETRLKEMTYEYWDLHCHCVGYDNKKLPKNVRESYRLQAAEASPPLDVITKGTSTPLKDTSSPKFSQAKLPVKRKHNAEDTHQFPKTYDDDINGDVIMADLSKKQISYSKKNEGAKHFHETETVILENKKLQEQCAGYEKEHRKLFVKEQMLRSQLEVAKRDYKEILDELQALAVKKE